ncbi:hypothetical protein [Ferruginibacter albus]|uniref:hypothetical protein n=1 Tax=Ferruginibacter albus TaxID=2875540 RepID=UPI001CC3DAAC|nr:hypothetical protein [Ferruginibacter albus]UAY53115.1 hypothetical protein K9M53_05425 [Ferruginibacter albus]
MAETLGMLCDKLTIVKLKQYHTDDEKRLESLNKQATQLQEEIDTYVADAVVGNIPPEKLTFAANKVFKKEGNETKEVVGDIGALFFQLADVNCRLWHEVEKGYDIENIPVSEKDNLVKMLAVLNLERNKCIDAIDARFLDLIVSKKS